MKYLLGNHPITSVTGYLLAALMAIQEVTQSGEINCMKITIAVGIAILGRASADASKNNV